MYIVVQIFFFSAYQCITMILWMQQTFQYVNVVKILFKHKNLI